MTVEKNTKKECSAQNESIPFFLLFSYRFSAERIDNGMVCSVIPCLFRISQVALSPLGGKLGNSFEFLPGISPFLQEVELNIPQEMCGCDIRIRKQPVNLHQGKCDQGNVQLVPDADRRLAVQVIQFYVLLQPFEKKLKKTRPCPKDDSVYSQQLHARKDRSSYHQGF